MVKNSCSLAISSRFFCIYIAQILSPLQYTAMTSLLLDSVRFSRFLLLWSSTSGCNPSACQKWPFSAFFMPWRLWVPAWLEGVDWEYLCSLGCLFCLHCLQEVHSCPRVRSQDVFSKKYRAEHPSSLILCLWQQSYYSSSTKLYTHLQSGILSSHAFFLFIFFTFTVATVNAARIFFLYVSVVFLTVLAQLQAADCEMSFVLSLAPLII